MASNTPGNSPWPAIIVAIITAAGVVLAAYFGPQVIVNINQQGQATAIAVLQPTINSLRLEPTSSPMIIPVTREVTLPPAPTYTPLPTYTPIPSTEPIVIIVTATPIPEPTVPPEPILNAGDTLNKNEVSLKMDAELDSSATSINLKWSFVNNSGKSVLGRVCKLVGIEYSVHYGNST